MSSRPSRGAARLAAILDALPDALLLVNANGTVVNANSIALDIFESPGTGLVGRGLLSLLPEFDSKLIPGSMRRPGDEPEDRTKPKRMTARRTDGSEFPVQVTSANLEDGREAYADGHRFTGDELLMLVVRDLSGTVDTEVELARSQRQTEMILRAAAEGVVGTDTDGRVVLVNPAAAQILGYRATELGNRELHALVVHSRADGSPFPFEESPLADTLRSGRKHRVRGQVLWNKAGKAVSVDLTTSPVRDGDQLVGAVMTFTDRRPYDALAARHAQLMALADEALRGPLEELRGELATLAADDAGQLWPEANQLLHHLAAGYSRMTVLLDNVLGFQRLDAGRTKLVKEKVLLDGVVAAGVEGAVELIGPGRAQFAVHAPTIEAEVDPARLATALSHLIADVAGVDATGKAPVAAGAGYMDSTIVVAAAQRGSSVRIEVRGPYAGGNPVHEPLVRGIVTAHGGVLQTHEVPGQSGNAYVLEVPLGAGAGTVTRPEPEPEAESSAEADAESGSEDSGTAEVPVAPAGGPRPAGKRARRGVDAFLDEEPPAAPAGEGGALALPSGRRRAPGADLAQAPVSPAGLAGAPVPPDGTGRRRGRALEERAGGAAPGGPGPQQLPAGAPQPPRPGTRAPGLPALPVPGRPAAGPGAQPPRGLPAPGGALPAAPGAVPPPPPHVPPPPVHPGPVPPRPAGPAAPGASAVPVPAPGRPAGPVPPGSAPAAGPVPARGLPLPGAAPQTAAPAPAPSSGPARAPEARALPEAGPVPAAAGTGRRRALGGDGTATAPAPEGRPIALEPIGTPVGTAPGRPAEAAEGPGTPGAGRRRALATPPQPGPEADSRPSPQTGPQAGPQSGPQGTADPYGGPAAATAEAGATAGRRARRPLGDPAAAEDHASAGPGEDHTPPQPHPLPGAETPTGRRRALPPTAPAWPVPAARTAPEDSAPGGPVPLPRQAQEGPAAPGPVRALGALGQGGAPAAPVPPQGAPEGGGRRRRLTGADDTDGPGRAYAIGAPAAGSAEGPEPLDGPGGAVEVVSRPPVPQPVDDELPPEPLDNPRRLLVWPAPDVATQQALSDRGYRPVIVHSREEVDAQIAAYPAALFVDPLTGPITRTALQSLRQAAMAAEVPVLVTAGLGQAGREAAYGADPAVLLKALAPRDSEQHPSRVLLIEQHEEIARALTAALERRGMQVAWAGADTDAVDLASRMRPNLVVMDLMQVRRRRAGIVDWLRSHGQLDRTPLVVYTSVDIDKTDLSGLGSGETVLFLAERATTTEVHGRIVDLLAKIGTR
ncbi:PAS domain-containing protein [Streptomyces sp. NPDC097619]|uniref:response regulator n=1 Tax=Streptomyces sp. NPDC097619 TaxID=3157228 RepID=UPI00331DC91F